MQTNAARRGDGWVTCRAGHRHWGRYGAAGVLPSRLRGPEDPEVLLQHRALRSHHGGTWGLLGGARDPGETPLQTALREANEESGLEPAAVTPYALSVLDHGSWSYSTVLATAGPNARAGATSPESIDVRWLVPEELVRLDLHPGFADAWPELRRHLKPLHLVVDAANVVGSRPDGWWRDRAGATNLLLQRCRTLARTGVAGGSLEGGLDAGLARWWPRISVVLEGAARQATDVGPREHDLEVVRAPGSGDDAVVDLVAASSARGRARPVVVTADRALRARSVASGAATVGPSWLLQRLDESGA